MSDNFKTDEVSLKITRFFDEETDEPICMRYTGSHYCKFLVFTRFGQQPVCGYLHNAEIYEETSRGFIKPTDKCPLHNGEAKYEN